jgi:hypothetical protein
MLHYHTKFLGKVFYEGVLIVWLLFVEIGLEEQETTFDV